LRNAERGTKMFISTIILLVAAAVVAAIVMYGLISDWRDKRATRQESVGVKECLEMCLGEARHSMGTCSSMCG
jgi:hypothetical protein